MNRNWILARYLSPDSNGGGGAIIDPDNTYFDEKGDPVLRQEEEEEDDDPPADPPAPAPKADVPPAADPKPDPAPAAEEEDVLQSLLKANGFTADTIEVEDGTRVKISELNAEQRLQLIEEETRNYLKGSAQKKAEPVFQSKAEETVVSFLRQGGDLKGLAKHLQEMDPAQKAVSDDELVGKAISDVYGDMTPEEVAAEIEKLKENGRYAKLLEREKAKQPQPSDEDVLTKLAKEQSDAYRQQVETEFQQEVTEVDTFLKSTKEIAGIAVDEETGKWLRDQIVPKSFNEESEFQKKLNDPAKVARLIMLDEYFEQVVEYLKGQAQDLYKKGKEEAEQLTRKFRDEAPDPVAPVRRLAGKKTNQDKGGDYVGEF